MLTVGTEEEFNELMSKGVFPLFMQINGGEHQRAYMVDKVGAKYGTNKEQYLKSCAELNIDPITGYKL